MGKMRENIERSKKSNQIQRSVKKRQKQKCEKERCSSQNFITLQIMNMFEQISEHRFFFIRYFCFMFGMLPSSPFGFGFDSH